LAAINFPHDFETNEKAEIGLAWLQISTGEFGMSKSNRMPTFQTNILVRQLSSDLLRLSPSEILIPQQYANVSKIRTLLSAYLTTIRPDSNFDLLESKQALTKQFPSFDAQEFAPIQISVSGALLSYISETQKGKIPRFDFPNSQEYEFSLSIDAATRRSLELAKTLSGEKRGSLLSVIDRTVTGPGARLLVQQLQTPSAYVSEIDDRLDCVEFFVKDLNTIEETRLILKQTHDMERSVQRVVLDRATPRDLGAIRDSLLSAGKLRSLWKMELPWHLEEYAEQCNSASKLQIVQLLSKALNESDLPSSSVNGGFIRTGYSQELDQFRNTHENSTKLTEELQDMYKKAVKLSSLKIKSNNVLGHFVEVPIAQRDKLLQTDQQIVFKPVQSTITVARFKTEELSKLELEVSKAESAAIETETKIFGQLCEEIRQVETQLVSAARALASIDVHSSLAVLARENNFNRPKVLEPSSGPAIFNIKNGRHPIVEQARQKSSSVTACSFIGNDCNLDGKDVNVMLVTGPNMGGKSTYLRQNALIVILAQMGSFVPTDPGTSFTVVDKLFSRVGASDELANDRSTFMVEMTETANILAQATPRSFVIIDEIGRGTATLDGLAIAWSVLEYLHDSIGCRTLFATHFHELTEGTTFAKVKPYSLGVRVVGDDLIFTYKIENKAADESYGVHVARLAGLPSRCITRAEEILKELKENEVRHKLPLT
jgi:DNA mismatch repair protein MutS